MANGTNRLRSTVRKLGRPDGGAASCGDDNLVSGGRQPEQRRKRSEKDGASDPPCGSDGLVSGGVAQPSDDPRGRGAEGEGNAREARDRLEKASAEILTALHSAKQELAEELDANLKQLKTVLEETQRIQKQMEAVLAEARCSSGLEEKALGGDQHNRREAGKDEKKTAAKPPEKKQDDAKQRQSAEGAGQEASGGGQGKEAAPTWKPPSGQKSERQKAPATPKASSGQKNGKQAPPPWDQLQVRPGEPPTWEPPSFSGNQGGNPPPWEPPSAAQQPQQPQRH